MPDEIDPDELSDEERIAWEENGKVPTRENGEPFGSWEHRPLIDASEWREWLIDNKERFSRDMRWRMGQPYGPEALVDCLRSEFSPYPIRAAACEELVVRYSLQVPFEVDLPVHQQLRFLDRIAAEVSRTGSDLHRGQWHFAGIQQT